MPVGSARTNWTELGYQHGFDACQTRLSRQIGVTILYASTAPTYRGLNAEDSQSYKTGYAAGWNAAMNPNATAQRTSRRNGNGTNGNRRTTSASPHRGNSPRRAASGDGNTWTDGYNYGFAGNPPPATATVPDMYSYNQGYIAGVLALQQQQGMR